MSHGSNHPTNLGGIVVDDGFSNASQTERFNRALLWFDSLNCASYLRDSYLFHASCLLCCFTECEFLVFGSELPETIECCFDDV